MTIPITMIIQQRLLSIVPHNFHYIYVQELCEITRGYQFAAVYGKFMENHWLVVEPPTLKVIKELILPYFFQPETNRFKTTSRNW